MSYAPQRFLLTGLMAAFAAAAMAQTPPPAAPDGKPAMHERMGRHDPAKMKEHMAKRQAALKQKLAITPAQESAWTAWTSTMQPPATPHARPNREEVAKLTTPERIDRMRAMRAERQAAMDKRADATKTFYAALTPEQQKVFDSETLKFGGRHGHGGHGRPHKG
ncbi:MAG: Spy/CpxP family protein refolding chaperone [Ramlibacter sp.]|nr:Spy/CpxP family protein refolding chaperone [Ramlibacter sp.]